MLRAFVAGLALAGLAQQATSQTFSADELARRTIGRRAVEAVIWGMAAVSYDLMRQAAPRVSLRAWSRGTSLQAESEPTEVASGRSGIRTKAIIRRAGV
jgi:hypothetical protein